MKIELDIGWKDLSNETKNKIRQLHKTLKGDNVKIKYPDVRTLFKEYDDIGHDTSNAGYTIRYDNSYNNITSTTTSHNSQDRDLSVGIDGNSR